MADKLPKLKELRAMSDAEMLVQLEELRQELWESSLRAREGSLQQPHILGQIKRQIARILTVQGSEKSKAFPGVSQVKSPAISQDQAKKEERRANT